MTERGGLFTGALLGVPGRTRDRESPTGEAGPAPPPAGLPAGRRETETGHQTTERMTHGIQGMHRPEKAPNRAKGTSHLTQGASTTLGVFYFILY